jgi:uncharacterized protein YaeQ
LLLKRPVYIEALAFTPLKPNRSEEMKGFHYHVDLKSHDPTRQLPNHIEMIRHAWEEAIHLTLRLLSFAILFEEDLKINGRPLSDDAPYQPSFGKWNLQGQPELWGECQPEDFKRIKKVATKTPASEWVISVSSESMATEALAALKRNKLRPGRFKVLYFEQELVDEMSQHLNRKNSLTWIHGESNPPVMQFDFNGLWFDSTFGIFEY